MTLDLEGDFYSTPSSLVRIARNVIDKNFDRSLPILEPYFNGTSLGRGLARIGFTVVKNDFHRHGSDYINDTRLHIYTQAIAMPPLSLWDDMVRAAKKHCKTFMFFGPLGYYAESKRRGNWTKLRTIYTFDRYVDYGTASHAGSVSGLQSAWFLWDSSFTGKPATHVLDVSKYATLGAYKPSKS